LGTGISEKQVKIIARLDPPKVYLFFDKDTAGVRNIEIAVPMLRKYPLYVVRYPRGMSDPAEVGEKVHRQIDRAVPALRFVRENGLRVERERISIG
jgi:DNA primase